MQSLQPTHQRAIRIPSAIFDARLWNFLFNSKHSLRQIERDLFSEHQESRTSAVLKLLRLVEKKLRTHETALALFRRCIQTEQDPWIIVTAARGIERIIGPVAAREMWLGLLNSSNGALAAVAAVSVLDRFYVPVLLDLLRQRDDFRIRAAAIQTLGRIQDPAAFPALIEQLATPAQRMNAAVALAELGDLRAMPYLEPLLADHSELPEPDDRGCVQRVNDIAAFAIRRLEFVAASKVQNTP